MVVETLVPSKIAVLTLNCMVTNSAQVGPRRNGTAKLLLSLDVPMRLSCGSWNGLQCE